MELGILEIATRVFAALLAGGAVGALQSYRARATGFRTHALVAAGAALMMVAVEQHATWSAMGSGADLLSLDPARVIQGVVTGVGFLGAGVIFKTGLTIHGLTTAAAVWVTAALGILFGVGLYATGALGAATVLAVLASYALVERLLPKREAARLIVRFARASRPTEHEFQELLRSHTLEIVNRRRNLVSDGEVYEENLRVIAKGRLDTEALADRLLETPAVIGFEITPRR